MREVIRSMVTVTREPIGMMVMVFWTLFVYRVSLLYSDPSWWRVVAIFSGTYAGAVIADVRHRSVRSRQDEEETAAVTNLAVDVATVDRITDHVDRLVERLAKDVNQIVTADEFAFERATSFSDETADALFRTVEASPKNGLAKGVLADRLDEIGEKWKWVSYAFRWCMKNGKCPYQAYVGEWWWNSSRSFGEMSVIPPGLFGATGKYSHASYPTQLAAYLGLAEAIRRIYEEVEV